MNTASQETELAEAEVWERLDVLLRLGTAQMEAGQSTSETIRNVKESAAGLGLHTAQVWITGRTVTVEYVDPQNRALSRTAAAAAIDAINCEHLRRLGLASTSMAEGRATPRQSRRLIDEATTFELPWWWTLGGLTLLAFCIGLQVGGTTVMALCAALVNLIASATARLTGRLGVTRLYAVALQCLAGAATTAALLGIGAVSWIEAVGCIAVSWTLLVPLPLVVSTVVDAVNADHLAAMARFASLALALGGIVLGGLIVVSAAGDLHSETADQIALPSLAIPLGLVFSMLGAISNAGGRALLIPAAAVGLFTACCNQALIHWAGIPSAWASTISAAVLGFAVALWARRSAYPAPVLALMGITGALLPGLIVFQGLALEMFHDTGLQFFAQAALIVAGLGVGVTAGFQLASFIASKNRQRTPVQRSGRRPAPQRARMPRTHDS